jgi:hypothetical protein
MPSPTTAIVPVTSAWTSKINWTQVVGGGAMLITLVTGGHEHLSGDDQAAIVTVIGLVQGAASWVMNTWFTPHVHAASLPSNPSN